MHVVVSTFGIQIEQSNGKVDGLNPGKVWQRYRAAQQYQNFARRGGCPMRAKEPLNLFTSNLTEIQVYYKNKVRMADIYLTRKLKEAGLMLDLPVLDHLIVSSEGFYSFADEG
jgi:hypothetical protein